MDNINSSSDVTSSYVGKKQKSSISRSSISKARSAFGATTTSLAPEIPNLIGIMRLDAINILLAAGFNYMLSYVGNAGGASSSNNDTVKAATLNGGLVEIQVYQYVQVGLPNVIGMNKYEAKTLLESLGWTFYTGYPAYPDGLWDGTGPGPNTGVNTVASVFTYDPYQSLSVGTPNTGQQIFFYSWSQPDQASYVSVDFGSGQLEEYVQAVYEPYNPYPNSGIVIGTGPGQQSAYVGNTITLPSQGDYQMVERKANFVNSGGTFNRQIPDQILNPPFVGWTDGQFIYTAGSSYTVPQPPVGQNVNLQAVWQTEAYSPTFTSFSPASGSVGSTVIITGKKLASIERVEFRSNEEAEFTIINDNRIEAVVPAGAITGRISLFTYSSSFATKPTSFIVV